MGKSLDQFKSFLSATPAEKPVSRREVENWQRRYADLRASYDAARTSTEYQNIWSNADRLDADSAHSKEIRHTLISRSRYEVGNNGYSDGIAQTYATDLVGVGPVLRMQTGSDGFNRMIELEWYRWCKAVQFRRKLWCMAHAKHTDGETFGIQRRNPNVRHPVKLDLRLIEAEQCQTPFLPFGEVGYIDGIKFDQFGNPVWYDILSRHPGATGDFSSAGDRFSQSDASRSISSIGLTAEKVPAEFVLHWFKMRRPGQHRAVPENASTLNTGAAARRWREATLAAAETAADFTVLLKTQFQPDSEEMQYATDFSQQEISKRMMTAMPVGYDLSQLKAEHPTATYEAFHKSLVNELARPRSMPYNKAACDSSSYNYASGRLDHQTYYASLDVEREDCNDLVLDPLFDAWFDLAVIRYGWLGGNPDAITAGAREHLWDWPKHRVADVESEANANETRLQSGQVFLHQIFTDAGMDFEDELLKASVSFGVTVEELRQRLLDVTYPPAPTPAPAQPTTPASDTPVAAAVNRIVGQLNGNGAHHG
jgi:capsid protein